MESLCYQFQGDSNLIPPFSKVNLADPMGVDGVPLVRVDDNLKVFYYKESSNKAFLLFHLYHKQARVGVDHLGLVASLQVPEDRRVVEESQVDHVLALLEPDHKQRRVRNVAFE